VRDGLIEERASDAQDDMLLAIDIGNTNTVLGVYDGQRLAAHWRLTTERSRTVDEYGIQFRNLFSLAGLDPSEIDAVIISSVVPPLNYTLEKMSQVYFQHDPLFVDHRIDTGMTIRYSPVTDVGADRIVNSVAAIARYGAPCIVVDFGTATTFDAITAEREYIGGVITPGIIISAEALFQRAARLYRVEIRRPERIIGQTTSGSMQAGLYYGYIGLVDGILRRMLAELGGQPRVVATGGLAKLIGRGSEFIEEIDENLTLEGLRLIYERNKG
jgi:type III pantothenate kinase